MKLGAIIAVGVIVIALAVIIGVVYLLGTKLKEKGKIERIKIVCETLRKTQKDPIIHKDEVESLLKNEIQEEIKKEIKNCIKGYLRTAGFHLLACGRGILFSKVSLLDAVSKKHSDWLERILRLIYNNGGFLVPIRW